MALIGGGADYRCSAAAGPISTYIVGRARIVVIAACSIRSRWVAATGCGITDARYMALIGRGADYHCPAANAGSAHIIGRARIGVVAACSIRSRGIAAYTCTTRARHMALIGGGADYRCPAADAGSAHIIGRTQIVVIAACSICCNWVAAYTCTTRARSMALIGGGANYRCPAADAGGAHIIGRAQIAVVAGCSVGNRRRNACAGHAGDRHAVVRVGAIRVHGACCASAGCRITGRWWRAHCRCSAADSIGAHIIDRAQIVVVAACSIRSRGIAANTATTGARNMALIGRGADYRSSGAGAAAVTNVVRGACIVVIAACSGRGRWVAAYAAAAGARNMALIGGGADYRSSGAGAAAVTNVVRGACIVVIAGCSVGNILAKTIGWITRCASRASYTGAEIHNRERYHTAHDGIELHVRKLPARHHLAVVHGPGAAIDGIDRIAVDVNAVLLGCSAGRQDASGCVTHRDVVAVPRNVEHLEIGFAATAPARARGAIEDVLGAAVRHGEERAVVAEEEPRVTQLAGCGVRRAPGEFLSTGGLRLADHNTTVRAWTKIRPD